MVLLCLWHTMLFCLMSNHLIMQDKIRYIFPFLFKFVKFIFLNIQHSFSYKPQMFPLGQRQNPILPNRRGVYLPVWPGKPLGESEAGVHLVRYPWGGWHWMACKWQMPPTHTNCTFLTISFSHITHYSAHSLHQLKSDVISFFFLRLNSWSRKLTSAWEA